MGWIEWIGFRRVDLRCTAPLTNKYLWNRPTHQYDSFHYQSQLHSTGSHVEKEYCYIQIDMQVRGTYVRILMLLKGISSRVCWMPSLAFFCLGWIWTGVRTPDMWVWVWAYLGEDMRCYSMGQYNRSAHPLKDDIFGPQIFSLVRLSFPSSRHLTHQLYKHALFLFLIYRIHRIENIVTIFAGPKTHEK